MIRQTPVERLINGIIEREGGYVNHKNDNGGPTKYGITKITLSRQLGRNATNNEVRQLTKETAFEIYYRLYYEAPNIDALPVALQPIMTDMSVNHGPQNAVEMLQDVLIDVGMNIGKIDGVCGTKTVSGARICWNQIGNDLIKLLIKRRNVFYQTIVVNNPDQFVFLDGWIKRSESFRPGSESSLAALI